MTGHPKQSQALGEVWLLLQRYRARFILPAFLTVAVVLTTGVLLPRKYQAEAIFERRNDMVLTEMTNRGASQTFQNPRASAAEEIVGQPALDQLLTTIGPDLASGRLGRRINTDLGGLRSDLQRMLLVRYDISTPELDRIRITYTASNPELARVVVNTLVENYIKRTRAGMDERLQQAADFFSSEADRERTAIETIENQMLTFEISHAEMLPDSANNIQGMMAQAQTEISDLEQKANAAALHEKAIQESLGSVTDGAPTANASPNPQYERLDAKRLELEAQLVNARDVLRMTDRHPDVIALCDQLAKVKEELAHTPRQSTAQTQAAPNPRRADLELMLANARADRQSLEVQCRAARERLTRFTTQSASLFPVRADYRKLTRESEQHSRQLAFWEDNLRRVRMALTAESGNRGVQLDFIKPAGESRRPVSPNLMQVLLAAVGLGLLAGAASVFLAQRGDESFQDSEAMAQATGLPVLGTVSEIISEQQRRARRLRNTVFYPLHAMVLASILLALAGVLYLSLERPDSFEQLKRDPAHFILHDFSADAAAPRE